MKTPETLFTSPGYLHVVNWFNSKNIIPFEFQIETWREIFEGRSGLVNAPTGYGKTFSVFLGAVIQFINHNPNDFQTKKSNGLQLIWITPLRALGKDLGRAMQEALEELNIPWEVGIRNGDT